MPRRLLAVALMALLLLTVVPPADARNMTMVGTAYIDGATVPDGALVRAYRGGVEVGSATTPATTQGTFAMLLSDVHNGDVLTFTAAFDGLTFPMDETKTVAATDADPVVMNLNGHADTVTGVTRQDGVIVGNTVVKAFIASTLVSSTTSGADGTYVLRVPGALGAKFFLAVAARKADVEYALVGGLSRNVDVEASNHAPAAASMTFVQVSNVATLNAPVRSASDGDEHAGDTMTYTTVWGDGTANDAVAGRVSNQTRSTSHTYAAEGQYTVTFYANDSAGASSSASRTYIYDEQAPTTTITLSPSTPNGNDGWYRTAPPSFTLSASDNGLAGLTHTRYKTSNITEHATYAASPVQVIEGDNTYNYWSNDTAGNIEPMNYYRVRLDVGAPTGAVTALPTFTTTSTVNLAWSTTDSVSGWASGDLYYKAPGAGAWTVWLTGLTNTSAAFPATQDGLWQFYMRGTDVAGNTRAAPSGTADASTTVSTQTPVTTVTPSLPMDRPDHWVTRPVLNVTMNLNGTIHYAWNPNLTATVFQSTAYTTTGAGVLVHPEYGCNVIGTYGVAQGVTGPVQYYRVCLRHIGDQAQFEGVNQTVREESTSLRNLVLAFWGHTNSTWAAWNATFIDRENWSAAQWTMWNATFNNFAVTTLARFNATDANVNISREMTIGQWAAWNATFGGFNASLVAQLNAAGVNLSDFRNLTTAQWAMWNATFTSFDAKQAAVWALWNASFAHYRAQHNDTWTAWNATFALFNSSLHLALALEEANLANLTKGQWAHQNSTWNAWNLSFDAFEAQLFLANLLLESNVTSLVRSEWNATNSTWATWRLDFAGYNASLDTRLRATELNVTNMVRASWGHRNDTWLAYNRTLEALNINVTTGTLTAEEWRLWVVSKWNNTQETINASAQALEYIANQVILDNATTETLAQIVQLNTKVDRIDYKTDRGLTASQLTATVILEIVKAIVVLLLGAIGLAVLRWYRSSNLYRVAPPRVRRATDGASRLVAHRNSAATALGPRQPRR